MKLSKIVLAAALVAAPFVLLALRYRMHEARMASVAERENAVSSVANELPTPTASPHHAPVMDKKRRDEMREKIYRAWGIAPPSETTHPDSWPATPVDHNASFGKEYVQQRIHEDYFPLAKDCYQQGLKKKPELAGKLVVSLRIVGTKNTGGLVDWVDAANEENTLDDPDVIECLKQSMYTVTFDPPPDDGYVTVTVPITFRPDQDGGDR